MSRAIHLRQFYALLAVLERNIGARRLEKCSGHMSWPCRGIYYFREHGENCTDTGMYPRIVRVGTHALKEGSRTKLWNRLSQHKGHARSGGGNHRGSIFRLLVGTAIMKRDNSQCSTWGRGSTAPHEVREHEQPLEKTVSRVIGKMPFLWLTIEDEPAPSSLRGFVERNTIALLSNYDKHPIDPPSHSWLGYHCSRERVRKSGLWNSNHVDEAYNPEFLDIMAHLIKQMGK